MKIKRVAKYGLVFSVCVLLLLSVVSWSSINVQDLPATTTYTVKTNGSYVWAVRYDGIIEFNSTDAATIIQQAIDASASVGEVFIMKADSPYIISNPIRISTKSSMRLAGDGAILKAADGFRGYYHHGYMMLAIDGSDNIVVEGLVLDGNKYHQTLSFTLIEPWNSSNVFIRDSVLKNSPGIALNLVDTRYGTLNNFVIEASAFMDNINETLAPTGADVYGGPGHIRATFRNLRFTRSTFYGPQAFYMSNNYGTYEDIYAENINSTVFDFRDGHHQVNGAWGKNVRTALVVQLTNPNVAANPYVVARHLNFADIKTVANVAVGAGAYTGTLELSDFQFTKKGGTVAITDIGVYIATYGVSEVRRCKVSSGVINGFVYGILIGSSGGEHTIAGNYILNSVVGIGSRYNSSRISLAEDNIFQNATSYKYYNEDGKLVVRSILGFVTQSSGTAILHSGTTSVTFAHGLSGTPQVVTFSWTVDTGSGRNARSSWWTADSTYITVHINQAASTDYLLSWYAEYKP